MAYVPGQKSDLFLSYAHADDNWVEVFRRDLLQGLLEKLGVPVALWQDATNLRLGQKWTAEITDAIRQTAAFLAICSPGFFQSEWCCKEYETLLADHPNLDHLKIGQFYRFLKIVKTPSPDRVENDFFSDLQHVSFFSEQDLNEYLPGTPEYLLNLRKTVAAISELLRTMRSSLQALYVAPPAADLEDDWRQLRAQWADDGYNVRPETILSQGFAERRLRQELENSTRCIFLLGGVYDSFLERQIDLAAELGQKMVFWIHPIKAAQPDAAQAALLARIRDGKNLPAGTHLLGGNSIRDVIHDMRELLKPEPECVPVNGANGNAAKVYLLYDATAKADSQVASGLSGMIADQKMTVFVPDLKDASASDRLMRHEQFLRVCDGVLVYRGQAPSPDNWLFQTMPDVMWAEPKLQRAPMAAKTFLVADPAPLQGLPNLQVIPYTQGFTPASLQPFFDQVRRGTEKGLHAGS